MISLYDLLDAADGQLFGEPSTQVFTDLALQPDQVEPGCLFVATQTLRGDGHQFMQAAVDRGALGLMCIEPPAFSSDGITVIVVRDVERALLNWARKVLERFGTTVIAACGAGEQETAVAVIAAVLGTRYPFIAARSAARGGWLCRWPWVAWKPGTGWPCWPCRPARWRPCRARSSPWWRS